MLGFLSLKKEPTAKVTREQIRFVSVPDGSSSEDAKIIVSPIAKLFAEKFNVDEVFLHFGKETIIYEFEV